MQHYVTGRCRCRYFVNMTIGLEKEAARKLWRCSKCSEIFDSENATCPTCKSRAIGVDLLPSPYIRQWLLELFNVLDPDTDDYVGFVKCPKCGYKFGLIDMGEKRVVPQIVAPLKLETIDEMLRKAKEERKK